MSRVKYQNFAVDAAGNVVSSSQVEVRDLDGALVTLYAAETGATEAYAGANPFSAGDGTPDPAGFFEFWVEESQIDITVGVGGSATTTREVFNKEYFYAARSLLVTDVASGITWPDGTIISDGSIEYVASAGSTAIADLPGLNPYGDVIYIEHFGPVGIDDLPLIQAAVAYAPVGSTISGKATSYSSTYPVDDTLEANVVVLETDNLTFDFSNTTFTDIVWYGKGTFGAEIDVGAGFTTGDQTINSLVAHGLAVGDHVQLLGVRNVYTTDAGDFQGGSQNPTNLDTPQCRHSEIHVVSTVPTATTATLYDAVVYPDYDNTSVGLSFPITDVDSSTIRKITPVKGIKFKGMTFNYPSQSSFIGFVGRGTSGLEFEDCEFLAGDNSGHMIRATDCYKTKMTKCREVRDYTTGSAFAYNSFVFAGGCHDIEVTNCNFKGGSQSLDFTPFHEDTEIGTDTFWSGGGVGEERYSTVQFMTVNDNKMSGCANGFTTHPATYFLTSTGNNIWGCDTGILARSRASTITGNTINSKNAGIVFSAFYDGLTVSGNTLLANGLGTDWQGVVFSNLSSETMNDNALRSVLVQGNTFVGDSSVVSDGLYFRHTGNGVPPNPSFTLFTDAIKIGRSTYRVSGNSFYNCGVFIGKWCNGIKILGNTFAGSIGATHYVSAPSDIAAIQVAGNDFENVSADAYSIGNDDAGLTYGYITSSATGLNPSRGPLVSTETNAGEMFVDHTNVLAQGGYTTEDGGSFRARRSAGIATTYLDAIPQDGTSDARVRVFGPETVTTGDKVFFIDSDTVEGTGVQATATDTTAGRLMRANFGYSPGNILDPVTEAAGVPTGGVIERGSSSGIEYTRYADGTQICWTYALAEFLSATVLDVTVTFPIAFSARPVVQLTPIHASDGAAPAGATWTGGYLVAPYTRGTASTLVQIYAEREGGGWISTDKLALHVYASGRWF